MKRKAAPSTARRRRRWALIVIVGGERFAKMFDTREAANAAHRKWFKRRLKVEVADEAEGFEHLAGFDYVIVAPATEGATR